MKQGGVLEMKNKKKMKNRLIAGIMSAAMLTSMGASTVTSVPVAAADNDYYEALALSLYFFDGNACGTDVESIDMERKLSYI